MGYRVCSCAASLDEVLHCPVGRWGSLINDGMKPTHMARSKAEITSRYERLFDERLQRLESDDQNDEESLGKDQSYELSYTRSHRHRFRQIWDDIPDQTDLSILDIGPTPFTFVLNKLMIDGNVATLDYTDLMKSRCEEAGITHVTHDLHEGTIPFDDEKFDVIIFHGVLEHLFVPPVPLIEDMARALPSGGRLLLGTPNFATLENRLKLVVGINPQESIEPDHVHGRGHVREYTLDECKEIVRESGLSVQRAENYHYVPMKDRIKNGVETTALGALPTPTDYLASTIYYTVTALIPSMRYHNYVVAVK